MATLAFNKPAKTATQTRPATTKGAAPKPLKQAKVEAPPAEPQAETAVAVVEQDERHLPAPVDSGGQLQGEFSARDMAVPYLNLGQKSGVLCDENPDWIGQWIFDKEIPLGDTVNVIFCRMRKFYEEVVEYGSQDIPQIFQTEAEARESGLPYRDAADISVLVQCNEEMEAQELGMLSDEDGRSYTPARYIVRSTAYRATVGVLLKDLAGHLKNDLASAIYALGNEKRSGKGNTWNAPVLSVASKVDAKLRKEIREKFGV